MATVTLGQLELKTKQHFNRQGRRNKMAKLYCEGVIRCEGEAFSSASFGPAVLVEDQEPAPNMYNTIQLEFTAARQK